MVVVSFRAADFVPIFETMFFCSHILPQAVFHGN